MLAPASFFDPALRCVFVRQLLIGFVDDQRKQLLLVLRRNVVSVDVERDALTNVDMPFAFDLDNWQTQLIERRRFAGLRLIQPNFRFFGWARHLARLGIGTLCLQLGLEHFERLAMLNDFAIDDQVDAVMRNDRLNRGENVVVLRLSQFDLRCYQRSDVALATKGLAVFLAIDDLKEDAALRRFDLSLAAKREETLFANGKATSLGMIAALFGISEHFIGVFETLEPFLAVVFDGNVGIAIARLLQYYLDFFLCDVERILDQFGNDPKAVNLGKTLCPSFAIDRNPRVSHRFSSPFRCPNAETIRINLTTL